MSADVDALTRQLEQLRRLASGLPDVIFRLNASGVILEVLGASPRVEREAVGQPVSACELPSVGARCLEAMQVARQTGTVQRFDYAGGNPLGSKWYELRVVALPNDEYAAIKRNITAEHHLAESLRAGREQAVLASSRKSQFLANLSHEIRTPLNAILGVTQLLQTQPLGAEQHEFVSMLDAAAESLRGLVNEVLDLSRIEEGRVELQNVQFDPVVTLRRAVEPLQQLAQRKSLKLEVVVAPEAEGTVSGDPVRFAQIITNLVANALKFTERGFVRVSLARRAERLAVTVADSGAGIAPSMLKEIFEPFVQASGNAGTTGTGLGLTITRHLATLMQGDVQVESVPGQGSTFTATLRLPSQVKLLSPAVPRRTGARALHVLLAEDDLVNARMTSALLEKLGHSVRVVGDGAAAVTASRGERFDLILMDVQMPVLDGLEATRAIRKAAGPADRVPIVALTANAMKGDEVTCLSAGMDAYLPKPVTIDALSDMLVWFSAQH